MKRKFIITAILIVSIFVCNYAQTWREMMHQSDKYSFKQVCQNFYDEEKKMYAGDSVAASKRKGIKPFKRWEWFWQQRLNVDGSFPDVNKHFEDWKNFETTTQLNDGSNVTSTDQTQVIPSYTSIGPFNPLAAFPAYGIGNITKMGFHSTNNNIFYAVSDGGHIWKTLDGGNSYQSMTDFLQKNLINDMVVDRANGDRVLFTTNADNKLYQTTNGGLTWNTISIPVFFKEIEQDPLVPSNWAAIGNYNAIYISTDNGLTWILKAANLSTHQISSLRYKANNSNILFFLRQDGISGPGIKMFRSLDGGSTWAETFTFTGAHNWYGKITTVATAPDLIEVLTINANGAAMDGLYKSTDGGTTFTKTYNGATASSNLLGNAVPPNSLDGQAYRNSELCINPNNINQQFIGGITPWRSNDGGVTWQSLGGNTVMHVDYQFIGYNPYNTSVLYVSNDGGIYKSNDNGTNWMRISNGLVCSQIYKVSTPQAASAGPQTHVIGLQDNGTKVRQSNGTYIVPTGGDGMDNAIDPINSNFLYTSAQNGYFYRVDLNNLNSPTPIFTSIQGAWVTPIVIDTSFRISTTQPPRLFIGYPGQIYKSLDRGNSWSTVPTNGAWTLKPTILVVSDSATMLVSDNDDVWRTANYGATWTKVLTSTPFSRTFKAIIVDPLNKNRIWVTTNSTILGYVIYSADGGVTWQNVTYNLPTGNYTSIEVQKSPVEALYVSSDNGIAIKGVAATTWSSYGTGLPYVAITEIQLDKNNNQLAVATYGRGLWTVPAYSLQNGGTCNVTNGASFNSGNPMNVKFNFDRLFFNAGNVYTVQLSDANGSFAVPTNLGTKTSSNGLDSTLVITPNNLPCGTNYRIRVIANNGADTTSITGPITMLVKPDARITNATNANGICPGGNLTLNAFGLAGYTYQWKLNGADITGATNSSYIANAIGNYQVKATYSCGDSTSTIYAVVAIAKPNADITPATSTTLCTGGSVVLNTITGTGFTYQWRKDAINISGATTSSYTANTAGQYDVKVTNTSGCDSTSLPATVTVNTIPATPSISAATAVAFCAGGSVTLTSNATTGNQWYNGTTIITGATNQTYAATHAGSYNTKVTIIGCTSTASNNITTTVNPLPVAPPINWNSTQFSTTSGLAGYRWFLNGTVITGANTNTYTPTSTGIYKVEITDANGCTNISVEYNLISTGLNTVQVGGAIIDVLPNPANTYITIKVEQTTLNTNVSGILYDATGKKILEKNIKSGNNYLNISNLPSGNYILFLKGLKETRAVPIIIIH